MCLARPAKIKSIDRDSALADFGGVEKKISLGVLSGIRKGDYVLVHAGFAIGKLRSREARDTFKALKAIKEVMKE